MAGMHRGETGLDEKKSILSVGSGSASDMHFFMG